MIKCVYIIIIIIINFFILSLYKMEQKYDNLFKKLDKISSDIECKHILQDKIYRRFIKNICNNKLKTIKEIKNIAHNVNKHVVKKDKNNWYA